MRDQLRALAKLAEIDASAKEIDKELADVPAHLESLRQDVNRLEQLLAMERAQLADAERLKGQQGVEAAQRNEAIARAKAKGAKARNAREAEAAERELETVRRMVRDQDEEIGRLDQAIEKVRASLAQHEGEFEKLRDMFRDEETKGRARIADLERDRQGVLAGRDDVAAKLPGAVLRRYDQIRARRSGIAVAAVIDGTCQGCRMQVPPQMFIQIQRCEDVQQCPHCLRILYFKPAIED